MQLRRLFFLSTAVLLATAAWPAGAAEQSCSSVSSETCEIARHLGRGINMGNMLDAPREGDWGVKLEPAYIDKVAGAFNTVRLPVRWSNHAAPTADATIDEAFAKRVDQVVDAFLAKGMYVILDVHHYTQINGDKQHPHEFTVDPAVLDQRLVNLWKQIALRYKGRSPKLMFELLNEPHDRLSGEAWNSLALRALEAVRASNPNRTVLIGPDEWNAIPELKKLRLPMDRNIIVMVHNYDPMSFTHQGVEWMPQYPVGPTCCDDKQHRQIADALDAARRWNELTGYPVYLGEFGSYEKADLRSRAAYTRIVRDEAEKRGIGWAYWEFASTFGVFDPKTDTWIEPLRHALLD
ncbi:MAG TPA: glycoside hydrolase family 5 protein [Ramlibacter sp.]